MEVETPERPRVRALNDTNLVRSTPSSWQAHLALIGAQARETPPPTSYASPDTVRAARVGRFTVSHDLHDLPVAVKKGDILGSINCLGLRFPISAPRDGLVTDVFASDDAPVEFGQPLVAFAA